MGKKRRKTLLDGIIQEYKQNFLGHFSIYVLENWGKVLDFSKHIGCFLLVGWRCWGGYATGGRMCLLFDDGRLWVAHAFCVD